MELYIQGEDHGRIILKSVENGTLVWLSVEQEDGTVRLKTYKELSNKEKLQADCDFKATNIFLQGLPPDVYALVNHHKIAKDIWDKIIPQPPQPEFPQIDPGLAVLTFLPGDDPIAYMNKAIQFLSVVFTPRYPSTNNQLRSSSNLRNHATVQDGKVTVQQVQGRQGQNVVVSGEGHMARQCTQQKQKRDVAWFKEKVLLVQVQAEAFQTKDLDAYDSNYDDIFSAKAVLMANLSSFDSNVLSEIQRISLTGFPAQSVGSSNTDVLDLPCLLVLITGTSQSRQHVDTSLIHIESRKSPTAVLFDDDTRRISIRHCEY
ncbi:hypothetical protein Tco_0520383 [Tanacetum coccineum]